MLDQSFPQLTRNFEVAKRSFATYLSELFIIRLQ